MSFTYRWVAACFAIADTDRDGKIEVMVGRHGETFGDKTEPYLLFAGTPPEAVDEFVGASPDRRFLAFVQQGRLWLVDAELQRRRDLSVLRPDLAERTHPALPHEAIAFSSDQRAVVARRSAAQTEVLLLDLISGADDVIYTTTSDVPRLVLEKDKLTVWTLPRGSVDDSFQTTLAPRHCRGTPSSFSSFRSKRSPAVAVDVPIPGVARRKAEKEGISGRFGCTANGMKVLASSVDGQRHLVATFLGHAIAEMGPLRWAVGTSQVCPRHD
jgi:hypothetical protein